MPWEFERSAYRIPYPPTARGKVVVDKHEFVLVDCSERGIRYVSEPGTLPELGTRMAGEVTLLSSRQPYLIEGTVVRCEGTEVAVALDAPGLPAQAIFAEQRYLARRFPARYSPATQR